MKKLVKGNRYIFNYNGNSEILKKLNGFECVFCAEYLGQEYVGIKFDNGMEATAYLNELTEIN